MYLYGDAKVHENIKKFSAISIREIIAVLDSFSKKWALGSPLFEEALLGLKKEVSFSSATIQETLLIIPSLFCRETLEKRLKNEIGNLDCLDRFTSLPDFDGKIKAVPLGTLLHVSAGNVFLGCIDSLLMGFLTKNISILKTSSKNNFFPLFFARALAEHDTRSILKDKFCIVSWNGAHGDDSTRALETKIKNSVNGIIAWGGEEMLGAYKKELSPSVKLFEYGPKISIQLITQAGLNQTSLAELAKNIVSDIVVWDQNACASPQNLFYEDTISIEPFLVELEKALLLNQTKRGALSSNDAVEILKEEYRAKWNTFNSGGHFKVNHDPEHGFLLHDDPHPYLRPSPLHRSLILKKFNTLDDLALQLKDFSFYLQSCGYALADNEKEEYLTRLAQLGMKRFAPVGLMMKGLEGAPHDGRYSLRELLNFIPDENPVTLSLLKNEEKTGYYFASGGTTGNPKFIHYSKKEFDVVTTMIAKNFEAQDVKKGMSAANLFAAGKMWSSFLAIDKALEKLDVLQLPIGMNSDHLKTLEYLTRFNVDMILGIPSFLVDLARLAQEKNLLFKPKFIFYAGEKLNQGAREFLQSVWAPHHIGSAGYASVDGGMMGYQCRDCHPDEHHLFSDYVKLEIENEEGFVTPLYRTTESIRHYSTGDRMRWVSEPCACGSVDAKFILLGRSDSQMNVFGCRFMLQDIEKSIIETETPVEVYQINILNNSETKMNDQLNLIVEVMPGLKINREALLEKIYLNSTDVFKTLSLDEFKNHVQINTVLPGKIERNSRTGKIKPILDLRN